ncbi:hypothetical protein PDL71_15400 [Lacibacter sp. MH-610]|uniref:hypothetical protein n=1 Tax=Lacibacter sp. MH-610 TaxID=3020883 RepID=UPI00389243D5
MRFLLTIFFYLVSQFAIAQHTSPLVNAGSDINLTLPVNSTSASASVTYYDGATMVSQLWTKVQTPRQQTYSIVIIGSSTAQGFGVTTAEYFGTKLSSYYKPLGLVDSVYNAGEGGQTIFGASITGRLNIGGSHQRKIIILSYPSNGYNGSTYTDAQILNRFREWRDSIVNRGYEYIVMGTQPREDFSAGDRTRLNRLNDSLILIFGTRFANVMKIGKNTGNDLWKTTMTIGDQVHGNGTFHTEINNLIRAINPFRYIAENFDKIRSSTSTSTAIDSLSYKGKHLYQFSVVDSDGHGGSDIVAVNANSSCSGTAYTVGAYYYNTNGAALQPGDTLFLDGNNLYAQFELFNATGTAGCPITIMNTNKQVTYRNWANPGTGYFNLYSCKYVNVTGTGSKDNYGIVSQPYSNDSVLNSLISFSLDGKSKRVTYSNILARNTGMGFSIKDEGRCDSSFNYPLWTIDSITIRNCAAIKTWNQGFYVGNTSPDNRLGGYDERPVNCSGTTKYPMPARMGNIRIFNCITDSTGRAGIQLSSASKGYSYIYNNIVKHSGIGGDQAQWGGIVVGNYTQASIFGNTVVCTMGWGIASSGSCGPKPLEIYDNYVDSAGYLNYFQFWGRSPEAIRYSTDPVYTNNLTTNIYSIFLATRQTENPVNDSTGFRIYNNRLGLIKNVTNIGAADYRNTFRKINNFICGNTRISNGAAATFQKEEAPAINFNNCPTPKRRTRYRAN